MKLYHATKKENIDSILNNGLIPNESPKTSNNPRLNDIYIYGFVSLQDAIDFMVYDNNADIDDVAVFAFEADQTVMDTEYDGNSFAAKEICNLTLINIEN